MSAARQAAAVAGGLLVLAVILTWPLALQLDSGVRDLGDPLLNSWILAWDLHALRHAPLHLFDANLFYPHRWMLATGESLLGLVPLAAPAAWLGAGPVLTHNLVLLLTFPLTGLAMFWLVRHLTGQPGAAVVAAILYAFSHYRMSHLSHVQLLSHQWLPLGLLGLHRAVASRGRWRDLALTAGAFALEALSSAYYAYFTAVTGGLFAIWVAAPATRPPLTRLARRALVVGGITAALLTPCLLPYYLVQRDARAGGGSGRPIGEVRLYSARPSSYLAAAPVNRWLGELTASLRRPEGTLFPGAVMLVLATAGAAVGRGRAAPHPEPASSPLPPAGRGRWPRGLDWPLAAFLLVTLGNALFVGGLVLRLGPLRLAQRHFGGSAAVIAVLLLLRRLAHGRPLPLAGLGWLRRLGWPHAAGFYVALTVVGALCSFGPTLWLWDRPVSEPLYRQLYELMPGFDELRVPARFAVLASTGLAVLAGYGAAALLGRITRRTVRLAAAGVLSGLAALEAWAVPIEYFAAPTAPGPADRWLAAAPAPGAVAILPLYAELDAHLETRRLLGSTAHWRPLVNGYSGFFPRGYWETVEILNAFPTPEATARLRALGVRYVVVYLGQLPASARARIERALTALPEGVTQVAALDNTAILEVRPP